MNESPEKAVEPQLAPASPRADTAAVGRILFLIAGGILLGTLVSCACGPIR